MIYIDLSNHDFIKDFCMDFERIPVLDIHKFHAECGTLQDFVSKRYHCFLMYGNLFNYEDDRNYWQDARARATDLNEYAKENSFDDWFDGYFKTSYLINDDLYVLHAFASASSQICITENEDLEKLVEQRPELLSVD